MPSPELEVLEAILAAVVKIHGHVEQLVLRTSADAVDPDAVAEPKDPT